MKGCNGPCEQGRLTCPTPEACEQDLDTQDCGRRLLDVAIASALAAAAVAIALAIGVMVLRP